MRALCVLHDAFSTSGLIGKGLRERGWQVDEVLVVPAERYHSPNVDFEFPDHREYDLLVPMGSPWAAYDDAGIGRWLKPELDWLSGAVAEGAAVFGICFGGQTLARALGGSVTRSAHPEIGWVEVEPDESGLVGPGPWFQWHFDTFTPPPGAATLARNPAAVQAYRIGRCLGLQFHPEVTAVDVSMWLGNGGAGEARAQGLDPAELIAETERRHDAARARTDALLDNYLNRIFTA